MFFIWKKGVFISSNIKFNKKDSKLILGTCTEKSEYYDKKCLEKIINQNKSINEKNINECKRKREKTERFNNIYRNQKYSTIIILSIFIVSIILLYQNHSPKQSGEKIKPTMRKWL